MPALETQDLNGLNVVVGMGASAGGLEPMHSVLRTFPLGHGISFVVVQHLAPAHPSALPALLQSGTTLHVQEAKDDQALEPDCVYVIAPGTSLSVVGGRLRVTAFAPELHAPPNLIDVLFRSLADSFGQRAVGVVLSGMGSDGSAGLRCIVEHGGLGLVQTPQLAQFDSMPKHAAAIGQGVRVGSVSSMTAQILALAGWHQVDPPTPPSPVVAVEKAAPLPAILLRLAQASGHDFSQYKPSTILRRIERRMAIHACASLAEYQRLLQASDQEALLLFKEVLIGVTEFFRDPTVWQHLQDNVLPDMLARAADRNPPMLRAWVVGCSTGEEAYSLGMLLTEALDALPAGKRPEIQIFASDLSADAIQAARRGLYPAAAAKDLSAERLARFFVRDGESWRVSKALRDMVLFARHDLLSDAPFTRLDLLCCRNLLIYLNATLQQRVLPLFHYVLLPGGHLVLGNAETIGRFDSAFSALDAKLRIYLRCDVQLHEAAAAFPVRPPTMSASPAMPPPSSGPEGPAAKAPAMPAALQDLADRLMLADFAPPAVLVDAEGNIVYVSGRTGRFLEPAAGKANWNVHVMAREGLRSALGDALRQMRATPGQVDCPGLVVDNGTGKTGVDLSVRSVDMPGHEGLALAIFHEFELTPRGGRRRRGSAQAARQPKLEEQLQSLREEMRCSHEEIQSTNEELQSTNEELQSTNEELQSANEELTTSKEEMQAMNEELQTVNAELMSRLQELALAQSDLKNLLNSTQIATLFLDGALNVRRFTEEARKVISLRESDVGRPLADLTSTLDYPALPEDISQVLRTMEFCERAVPTQDGRWFSVRIMPYRTQDNVIDGSVITFVDITRAKQLEARLRLAGGELPG